MFVLDLVIDTVHIQQEVHCAMPPSRATLQISLRCTSSLGGGLDQR